MSSPEELVSSSCLNALLNNLCSVEPFLNHPSPQNQVTVLCRPPRVSSWPPQSSGLGILSWYSQVFIMFSHCLVCGWMDTWMHG